MRWDSGKDEDCVFTGDGGDYQLILSSEEGLVSGSLNVSRASSTESRDRDYTLDQISLNVTAPPFTAPCPHAGDLCAYRLLWRYSAAIHLDSCTSFATNTVTATRPERRGPARPWASSSTAAPWPLSCQVFPLGPCHAILRKRLWPSSFHRPRHWPSHLPGHSEAPTSRQGAPPRAPWRAPGSARVTPSLRSMEAL